MADVTFSAQCPLTLRSALMCGILMMIRGSIRLRHHNVHMPTGGQTDSGTGQLVLCFFEDCSPPLFPVEPFVF